MFKQGRLTFWRLWATLEEEELSWATHEIQCETSSQKSSQCFKYIYDFVLGCIHSPPGLHVAYGLLVGCPW